MPTRPDGSADEDTVIRLLSRCTEACPDQRYLEFEGDAFTYADVWDLARGYASTLRIAGIRPGDTVAAMLGNSADAVAVWFATNMLGAIWIGVNTGLKGEFLRHVINDSAARVVVCESELVERFDRIASGVTGVERLLVRGEPNSFRLTGTFRLEPLVANSSRADLDSWLDATADDVACLVYTGGTTGPSKGCVISHGYVFNAARGILHQSGRQPDELNWNPLPIYHFNLVSGTLLGTMLLRGSASVASRFSVSRFWPEMQRTGAQMVNLLGSMGSMIAGMAEVPEMRCCYGQIRVVHGVPFPPELQRIWRDRFGVAVVGTETYGSTEAFPQTTLPAGQHGPPGSSGRVNAESFDVRIVDDRDEPVAPGDTGEVVCRPLRLNVMFSGYWQHPQATVDATTNLWFHSGDLGRFDEDGYFYFVDRKKDYLRRRGENISSQEMEAAYLTHPDVAQVAVHAVPSAMTEDDIKVTAVLVPGSTLTPEQLYEWSIDVIPDFAMPRYIEFRSELPLSPVGRVHKYLLRDEGCTPSTWDRELADPRRGAPSRS